MKLAVCVPSAQADCYGHHTRYAERLAELGAERSIEVEVLRYTAPDFFARLFTNLMDDECIVHFHSFLYDLRILATSVQQDVHHALDNARARTMATVADHPFANFMHETIRHAHPSTKFIVFDKTFPDEMQFMNRALEQAQFAHLPFTAPVSFDETNIVDYDARAYDLVLPLFLVDTRNMKLSAMLGRNIDPWFVRAVNATYEIARSDISRNPFHILSDCMVAEIGISLAELGRRQPDAVQAVINVLSSIDGLVRQERRAAVIQSLLRSVGDLRVAVLGDPLPSLSVDERVEFVGTQRARETSYYMANARAVLNCSPSYPTNVHERVTVGMLYESCVITDINPCIAETFTGDDLISYAPGSDRTIADLFDAHDTRAIAAAGRNASQTERFSWPAHFKALVEIAHA